MTSAFRFVPRTVSKVKRTPARHVPPTTVSALQPTLAEGSQAVVSSTTRLDTPSTSNKSKYSNEDYACLLCLALSDYALWADPDLRRKMEWSSDEEGQDGFFALSYLLKHSKILAALKLDDLQIPIAKALRSDAIDVLEVRLLVSDPSSSTWFGGHDKSKDIGAYEIRRKDWADNLTRLSREYSRADWERRTVYVENIPVQYKTTPAILRFMLALLAEHPSSTPPLTRVQSITFPPHHQDKPGDQPTFKGFALLVFNDERDVSFLLQRWPWGRQHTPAEEPTKAGSQEEQADAQEAVKFGFRALSKLRWDQLKDEYLSYRGRLVAEINARQEGEPHPVSAAPTLVAPKPETTLAPEREHVERDEPDKTPTLDYSSPYPFNSLVFVRSIHPETNKTTLRKFFATAFGPSLASGALQGDGLDYVDFNKGMDTCHVRLATPKHAQILVDHFHNHPTSHSQGLDEVGIPVDAKSQAVAMELVTGRREALYWEKVPEKVRRQAVQKAVASLQAPSSYDAALHGDGGTQEVDNTRKRKRRKH